MLLRCEVADIAKQLRDVDLRNLIRFKPNPEALHGIFLKKFTGKLVRHISKFDKRIFALKYTKKCQSIDIRQIE